MCIRDSSASDMDGNGVQVTWGLSSTKVSGGAIVNPERLGVFTVEDASGWHVSFVRTIGNLNLLAASDDAVNQAVDGMWSATGAYGADVSKDEIRDLALNNKPVGALLVIGWNFAKNA